MKFWLGVVLTTAVAVSIVRRRHYPTFRAWWDAEGIGVWILAGMFVALYWI
jgi:hypothetical protein